MQVSWNTIKELCVSKLTNLNYVEEDNRYVLNLNEVGSSYFCMLPKTDPASADQEDFELNFKPLSNKPNQLRSESLPFSNADGFRFRGASFKTTVPTGATTDYDYLLTAERWINGGRLIVDNIGEDDTVTFQIVDKDDVFGLGEGTVLDEFINSYYVPHDGSLEVALDYPAKLAQGLYIRLKYTSTHVDGCTVKCNLYLHMKT